MQRSFQRGIEPSHAPLELARLREGAPGADFTVLGMFASFDFKWLQASLSQGFASSPSPSHSGVVIGNKLTLPQLVHLFAALRQTDYTGQH